MVTFTSKVGMDKLFPVLPAHLECHSECNFLMTDCKPTAERHWIRAARDHADEGRESWGGGQGAGAITTVEQFLMRGLATACQACVVGAASV